MGRQVISEIGATNKSLGQGGDVNDAKRDLSGGNTKATNSDPVEWGAPDEVMVIGHNQHEADGIEREENINLK